MCPPLAWIGPSPNSTSVHSVSVVLQEEEAPTYVSLQRKVVQFQVRSRDSWHQASQKSELQRTVGYKIAIIMTAWLLLTKQHCLLWNVRHEDYQDRIQRMKRIVIVALSNAPSQKAIKVIEML